MSDKAPDDIPDDVIRNYLGACEAVGQCVQARDNLDDCRQLFHAAIDLVSTKLCRSSLKDMMKCHREFVDQKFPSDLASYDPAAAVKHCARRNEAWQACVVRSMKRMDEIVDDRQG